LVTASQKKMVKEIELAVKETHNQSPEMKKKKK